MVKFSIKFVKEIRRKIRSKTMAHAKFLYYFLLDCAGYYVFLTNAVFSHAEIRQFRANFFKKIAKLLEIFGSKINF